jgi:hypothetical protein
MFSVLPSCFLSHHALDEAFQDIYDLYLASIEDCSNSSCLAAYILNSLDLCQQYPDKASKVINLSLVASVTFKIWPLVLRILNHTQKDKLTLGNIVFTSSSAISENQTHVINTILTHQFKILRPRDIRRCVSFLFPQFLRIEDLHLHDIFHKTIKDKKKGFDTP